MSNYYPQSCCGCGYTSCRYVVQTGQAGAVINLGPAAPGTAGSGGNPGPMGPTGPMGPPGPMGPTGSSPGLNTRGAPAMLPAAQYAMRTAGATYGSGTILPYQSLIQQPADSSIRMDDRTLAIQNSGNYLINISVSANVTTGIPNVHAIVTDNGGTGGAQRTRDIDLFSVMNQGTTSSSLLLPISGPGRVYFQVQGANSSFTTPPNQPQGQLSIARIT